MRLPFEVEAEAPGTRARAGRLRTLHGEALTPIFMPVGTLATVRGQTTTTLVEAGARILLANTYHLMLKPGADVFRKFGGIHRFMSWGGSVLTDSGGYQIFSLPGMRHIEEKGAVFRPEGMSRIIQLTPERSIETQLAIGSDIMMALDVCIPSTSERELAIEAMDRTHRWAERSLKARGEAPNAIFGIVQGACYPDLRAQSARAITSLDFDGFAIGGLAVGESKSEREDMTALTTEYLPRNRPRYLMGVGTPIDLLEAVHRGVDLFDCIIPTAWAQRGAAFTRQGKLALRRTVYQLSDAPIDPTCPCPICATHSRGYLHHLVKAGEIAAWQLIGTHNLHFYASLMRDLRLAIVEGRFEPLYRELRDSFARGDEENPLRPPRLRKTKAQRKKKLPEAIGDFEVVQNASGTSSIRQVSSGEIMHSVNDPEQEARTLYVEQSRLESRLREKSDFPLVLWDVGLGAGTNAMAALRVALETESQNPEFRGFRMVSFEQDLDPLRLAVARPDLFPHTRHSAPHGILKQGRWASASGKVVWDLIGGDFLENFPKAAAPDLVFFDPFSPQSEPELWELELFRKLGSAWGDQSVEIFTYSNSTAVRASWLAAGFFVGPGKGIGPKSETTVAWTPRAIFGCSKDRSTLGQEWLGRWERSAAKIPRGISQESVPEFDAAVRRHPQFQIQKS